MTVRFFCLVVIGQFISSLVSGQVVLSSCDAPDSIKALYRDDADRFALDFIKGHHLPEEDSIRIPAMISDSFLRPLIAVYNATSIPERDSVVTIYKIHEFPYYFLDRINIAADSTLPWMQMLRQGIFPTGNIPLDSILTLYHFQLYDYEDWSGWFSWHVAGFESDSNFNVTALGDVISTFPGVDFSEWDLLCCDGDHISMYKEDFPFEATVVTYSLGWGDCLSGCTDGRSWIFKVYADCSVEFVGAYGSHVPFTATQEILSNEISIHPNPFDDYIEIDQEFQNVNFVITNVTGIQQKSGVSNGSRIEELEKLLPGIYFLTLSKNANSKTYKILKR